MIVKADYLGLTSGTNIEISHGKETLTSAIVNDEISHLVMNDDSKMCEYVNLVNPDEDVPQTIAAIFKHRDRREWLDSVLQEYTNLASKGTWRIALLPKGRKMLGCRLVLKRKMDKNGNMPSRKARCVIQGYTQVEGVDYQRLFQPEAALNTLRNQCCFCRENRISNHGISNKNSCSQTWTHISTYAGPRGSSLPVVPNNPRLLAFTSKKRNMGASRVPAVGV